MNRPASYHTRQREAILAYIASLKGGHATAAQVAEHFAKSDAPVSRTTVYRHLERLSQSGEIHKYTVDGSSGACFQYAGEGRACREHFHLKCECCGKLAHLECDTLEEIKRHVSKAHAFEINPLRTVLYGRCHRCAKSL